jgi:hypothetical protein
MKWYAVRNYFTADTPRITFISGRTSMSQIIFKSRKSNRALLREDTAALASFVGR